MKLSVFVYAVSVLAATNVASVIIIIVLMCHLLRKNKPGKLEHVQTLRYEQQAISSYFVQCFSYCTVIHINIDKHSFLDKEIFFVYLNYFSGVTRPDSGTDENVCCI